MWVKLSFPVAIHTFQAAVYPFSKAVLYADEVCDQLIVKQFYIDNALLKKEFAVLVEKGIFTTHSQCEIGKPNNRGHNHYRTDFSSRTMKLIRLYAPKLATWYDWLEGRREGYENVAEVLNSWMTHAEKRSNINPNGGNHSQHGDAKNQKKGFRALSSWGDSESGKIMIFQNRVDGRWFSIKCPSGTTVLLNDFAGGASSNNEHLIRNCDETYCLLAQVELLSQRP